MRIALLCNTSAGGSGILATELALGLSQLGHDIHIVGERRPFRLPLSTEQRVPSEPILKDLGDSPPIKSFWGELVSRARRSFAGRFRPQAPSLSGKISFHEMLTFEYPLFEGATFPTLRAANTLASLIDRFKIEVINAHYAIPHATSALLARESGLDVRVVTTLHGTDITRVGSDPAFKYTTRHALINSDAVTAVCEFLSLQASKQFSINKNISVIPNWVDSHRFVRQTNPKMRARFVQPEECLIIHASNFRPVKRSTEAVKIFAKVLNQTPARLILVGDGPEKKDCIDLAIELGVSGRVLSIPATAAIEELMGISDVLLLPSEIEAFPLVVLEAMSAGAITIASDVGGLRELITDRETGFLMPLGDSDQMAAQVLELAKSPELTERIRIAARKEVVEKFSPESRIKQYLAIYEAVLANKPATGNK